MFLVFDDLGNFEVRYFCRMSLNLDLSQVFLMIKLRLWVFGRNVTEVKHLSHYIISECTWYPHDNTGNVNLSHLVKVVPARFLHCEVTMFPILHSILWKWVTKSSSLPKQRRWWLRSTLGGGSIYINYLEFFCKEHLSLLPHLFISILSMPLWTHGHVFYTLGYNQMPHYFVAKIVPASVIGSSFSLTLVSL